MQCDHLRDKEFQIGDMVTKGLSEARLRAELAKCDIVCANCHAERTHQRVVAEGKGAAFGTPRPGVRVTPTRLTQQQVRL